MRNIVSNPVTEGELKLKKNRFTSIRKSFNENINKLYNLLKIVYDIIIVFINEFKDDFKTIFHNEITDYIILLTSTSLLKDKIKINKLAEEILNNHNEKIETEIIKYSKCLKKSNSEYIIPKILEEIEKLKKEEDKATTRSNLKSKIMQSVLGSTPGSEQGNVLGSVPGSKQGNAPISIHGGLLKNKQEDKQEGKQKLSKITNKLRESINNILTIKIDIENCGKKIEQNIVTYNIKYTLTTILLIVLVTSFAIYVMVWFTTTKHISAVIILIILIILIIKYIKSGHLSLSVIISLLPKILSLGFICFILMKANSFYANYISVYNKIANIEKEAPPISIFDLVTIILSFFLLIFSFRQMGQLVYKHSILNWEFIKWHKTDWVLFQIMSII